MLFYKYRKAIISAFVVVGVITVMYVAWRGYHCALFAIEAEYSYCATVTVIFLVDHYLDCHNGKWPESWEDLESIPFDYVFGKYRWPADSDELQARVTIDFDVDIHLLANQSWEEFTAIRPIGPSYNYKRWASGLLERVQKYHGDVSCPDADSGSQENSHTEITGTADDVL